MGIKPGKYKTREGNDAVVLVTDVNVDYHKIIGYVIRIGVRIGVRIGEGYTYASACHWEDDGRCYTTLENKDDLVEFVE